MNKLFFAMLFFTAISCNRKNQDTPLPSSAKDYDTLQKSDSTVYSDRHYYWIADLAGSKGLVMKKTNPISEDSLTANAIIEKINEEYPEIKISYVKDSNDTIFISINKSSYLTDQMGSSGAEAYLAEVTFNLTELKGINKVSFSFKVGNHATPGIYSRTDFINEPHH